MADGMTAEELYRTYAAWTGQLHFYVANELGSHIDCEYLPDSYEFRLYSGRAQDAAIGGFGYLPATVPGLRRPAGEASATIKLPRPGDDPTSAQLDAVFRDICLAAAHVLRIDLGKPKLGGQKKHALPDESNPLKRRRLGPRKKKDRG